MPLRPVYWHEGMFLGPHHFQVADRQTRLSIKESEDWFHPFCWGVRQLRVDEEALAAYELIVREGQVRFSDGTRLSIPADTDGEVRAPELVEELKRALTTQKQVTVLLAIPNLQSRRPNVDEPGKGPPRSGVDAPARPRRYWIEEKPIEDENSGADEQSIMLLRVHCRLLLSTQKSSGYQTVPLFQVVWKGHGGAEIDGVDSPIEDEQDDARADSDDDADASEPGGTIAVLDRGFVPPLLTIDAWEPLWHQIQGLHRHVVRIRNLLADQVGDRYLLFESNVPGDAERLLMLSVLNGVDAALRSFVFERGLPPLDVYRELCRVLGQLSTFGPGRTTPDLMGYKHDDLGPCFREVMRLILLLLRPYTKRAFEKEYFKRVTVGGASRDRGRPAGSPPPPTPPTPMVTPSERPSALGLAPRRPPTAPPPPASILPAAPSEGPAEWLQVHIKEAWFGAARAVYLGVESEIPPEECFRLLSAQNVKLASGSQVREFGRQGFRDLQLDPIAFPPDELRLRRTSFYRIVPDQRAWPGVLTAGSIALFFVSRNVVFRDELTVVVTDPNFPQYPHGVEMRFALFVIRVRQ